MSEHAPGAEVEPELDEAAIDRIVDGLMAEPWGEEVPAEAARLYRDEFGLPLPPIPRDLVPGLRFLGPGLVGTREDTPDPYGLDWFVAELQEGPEPYLILGQAGYGVRNWAMHYYLVRDRLALFLQLGWGGAYRDAATATARAAAGFAAVARLLELADRIGPEGLVVVSSDVAGSRLGRLSGDGRLALEDHPTPLTASIATLEQAEPNVQGSENIPHGLFGIGLRI
jgi:hypothetical protein